VDEKQDRPWTTQEFEQQLRALEFRYHVHHPFHIMMNEGRLTPDQIRGWVANRFYYQFNIPIKDAAILSNCTDRKVRRLWVRRLLDQDGYEGDEGGLEAWIRLGIACGISREDLTSLALVLPAVRFAVDAYVNFARTRPWQEAACASLSEMFAPQAHQDRLNTWPRHYPWIDSAGLDYFRSRLSQAQRDVQQGLALTLAHFTTRPQQERALEILRFKLDVLWSLLDAVQSHYCGAASDHCGAVSDG
jgi:pyrroloquinoline-quinone synthase